jgi:putative endopeptidase
MSARALFALSCVVPSFLLGCHPQKASVAPPPAAAETGIDEGAINRQVSPCDDFYEYACGSWLKKTEIPADRSTWMRGFSVIDEQNDAALKAILEEDAAGKGADASAKQLGDFYASCMDEAKIEANAKLELDLLLKPLEAVKDMPSLAREVARQHLGLGAPLFGFGQQQDFKDANQVIGSADQGGLGLPDRDYYVLDDESHKTIRSQYQAHVAKLLELSGVPAAAAAAQAPIVLKIETELAKISMTRVDRRVPEKLYHRIELKGLVSKAPKFPWALYLKELGVPGLTQINVVTTDYFVGLNKQLGKILVPEWRIYLRWHLVHAAAPLLSKAFVDENFAFYEKTLSGTAQLSPRWKRCVESTDRLLGEALAKGFVMKTFGEDGKTATHDMIVAVEKAMEENLSKLPWMDDATRKAALEKLGTIANKIGYPDVWRDYSAIKITRDSFVGNVEAAAQFENKRQLTKIGKPVDRTEWLMTPPTVNAYYEPSKNEMVFPAGILQPPFFNRKAVPAVNYGAIGMVMGHELTHGFDDEGRKFDAKGNMTEWWTPATNKEFDARAQCVIDQYNGYEVIDGQKINGKLTTGENIADLGGIKLAFRAFQATHKPGPQPEAGKGYSDEQLFFLGTAQAWCGKRRDALEKQRLLTDPHSTPRWRVNGPLANLSEFAAAFQCKPGSKMVRENACTIW